VQTRKVAVARAAPPLSFVRQPYNQQNRSDVR